MVIAAGCRASLGCREPPEEMMRRLAAAAAAPASPWPIHRCPCMVMPTAAPVVITELMFHPVLENADSENHEFVEIFNRSDAAVVLDDWKLPSGGRSGVAFSFSKGTTIMPGTVPGDRQESASPGGGDELWAQGGRSARQLHGRAR